MDETIRNAMEARIGFMSVEELDIARKAYDMGHEDGWWLNRKNPDLPASEICEQTNPFANAVGSEPPC